MTFPALPAALGAWRDDLALATGFLTRLPLGPAQLPPPGGLARSLRAFPLVGLALGGLGALAYLLASWIGLPPWPAAFLALGVLLLAGGGLHEDGLADTADGFGAPRRGLEDGQAERERRLAIMRDSRSGAFGVLALVWSLCLRVAALATLAEPGAVALALLAAGCASRGLLPLALFLGAPARSEGLAAAVARPPLAVVATALAIAALALLLLLGFGPAFLSLLLLAGILAGLLRLAQARIGGYTGDVLGGLQQAAEILVLLVCVVAMR